LARTSTSAPPCKLPVRPLARVAANRGGSGDGLRIAATAMRRRSVASLHEAAGEAASAFLKGLPRRNTVSAAVAALLCASAGTVCHSGIATAWAGELDDKTDSSLGKLWEQADGRLGQALGAEDKELQRAEEEIKRDQRLEGQSENLQEREREVIRKQDEDAESKLEVEEEALQARMTEAEKRLNEEAASLEQERAQLLKEESRILKKTQEIQQKEEELLQEQSRLQQNKERLVRSEGRLQDALKSRRDRAPRLGAVVDVMQLIFGGSN